MALNTISSDRLSTNVKTSNLGTELKKKVGQNKNLIINGAMQVAQRGTSSTTNGYGSVDRFRVYYTGNDEAPTHAQADIASGTTPYTLGFRKSYKITNGNQTSGAGAADVSNILTTIEAQDVANSGWNYTSASSFITLSFWVKSSVAQNFYGYVLSADGTEQRYAYETGSLSADTWTKITKTIPGNSNLVFNNDNGHGLEINISPFWGTNSTDSGVSLNAWAAHSSSARTPDSTSTWFTTNDATFEITGVQLEVGSVATDFEHRSYADEYKLCSRYFQYTYNDEAVGTSSANGRWDYSSFSDNGGNAFLYIPLATRMRFVPTVTFYRQDGTANSLYYSRSGASGNATPVSHNATRQAINAYLPVGANFVGANIQGHWTCDAEL